MKKLRLQPDNEIIPQNEYDPAEEEAANTNGPFITSTDSVFRQL